MASASSIAINDGQGILAGLGVYSFKVVTPGLYYISGKTIPVPASGITIAIAQNASPITSSTSIVGDAGGVISSEARITCAAADVLTVTITAVSPNDVNVRAMQTIAVVNLLVSGS